jgi:Tfp pilus assembly protein PilO
MKIETKKIVVIILIVIVVIIWITYLYNKYNTQEMITSEEQEKIKIVK